MLLSYYYPFFVKITLIFDGNPQYNFSSLPSFAKVLFCDSHLGWYQHKCIRKCINQGSNETQGYLYISDDMFINITKMAQLPRSKVWFLENAKKSFSWIQNPGAAGWGWQWWGPPYENSLKLTNIIYSFPKIWRNKLKKYSGFPDNFSVVATSDIIYIPQRVVPEILPVLDHIISHENLFCEIATALAVNVASPDFVKLEYGYLWADRSIQEIERKSLTAHFVHPIKLSQAEHAAVWVKNMEKQLYFVLVNNVALTE